MHALVALLAIASSPLPNEREISFNGVGEFKLYGTLMTPSAAGRSPCVLLLPGSGPTDRNGNQPPGLITDLEKQIAERLAEDGIATFRFDKRAAMRYQKDWPDEPGDFNVFMDFECFFGDARAAFETMMAQPEVDGARSGVMGHSEGCLLALKFVSRMHSSRKPKALVLLGGPGRLMSDVLRQQMRELFERQKLPPDDIKANMAALDKAMAQIAKDATLPKDIPNTPIFRALFPANATKLLHGYFTVDPVPLAKAYSGPVLLMNGEFDQDVSPTEDTPLLKKAFESRVDAESKMVIVPHASHCFKDVPDRMHGGYTGPVIPSALTEMSAWLKSHL